MFEEEVWKEATEAAIAAHDACVPTPMIVGQALGLFGSEIVPGTEEFVADGVCGFSWIRIKPARGPLVKWLKREGKGDRGVYGGWTLSPSDFDRYLGRTQSMLRKEAAVRAACKVLKTYYPGSKIWVETRLD